MRAGSISSTLLEVESSGARITLKMVAHTRLTARQKFSWCATGISLKLTTWMRRKIHYKREQWEANCPHKHRHENVLAFFLLQALSTSRVLIAPCLIETQYSGSKLMSGSLI